MQKFFRRRGWLARSSFAGGHWPGTDLPDTASAQGKKKAEAKEPEQAYMLPYIMTAVAILVGLAVVCMPSQRKDEVDMSSDLS